jgi:hypothetical protein
MCSAIYPRYTVLKVVLSCQNWVVWDLCESKAVPLHTMEEQEGREV